MDPEAGWPQWPAFRPCHKPKTRKGWMQLRRAAALLIIIKVRGRAFKAEVGFCRWRAYKQRAAQVEL
jgi:hypothetical protein